MRIKEIMKQYMDGNIDVKSYEKMLFEKYEELLEYKNLISQSKVNEIVINEREVLFKMLLCTEVDKNKGYELSMEVYKKDYAAVQNTVLTIGEYEPLEFDMVSRIASYVQEGVFLDIGANLGWYAMNMKKQYPEMKVFAFEPIKENFDKMKRNFKLNELDGINCFNVGLFCENTNLKFYYDVCASGASSVENLREDKETREVYCKVERLDDFVNENDIVTLDFIKCDVEGSELFVYKGGINSIKKYKPVIFSEILRKWSAKFGYHPNDVIDLLETVGYQCFVIKEKSKLKKFGRVNEHTIETNYFFLHPEKHAKIIFDLVEK